MRTRGGRPPQAGEGDDDPLLASLKAGILKVGGLVTGLSRRQRWAIGLTALAIAGVAYFALPEIPGSQHIDLRLQAGQGTTSFSLAPEKAAISPGCGCPHPEYGAQPWEGMSVPSRRFQMDLEATPSDEISPNLWSLTAMAPNTGPINWYGEPNRAVWIYVEAQRPNGGWKTLFYGATSHFMLWTPAPVSIHQAQNNPYMAVLPAAGGSTTFTSHEAARAQWANTVDVSTTTPPRGIASPKDAPSNPEIGQRGPMMDVLGPTVTLSVTDESQSRMWAGRREISGARPGEHILIYIETPFAVRLIPHPVQLDWESELAEATSQEGFANLFSAGSAEAKELPRGQGRVPLRESLPSYTVRMSHIDPPDSEAWASFARRSKTLETIPEMMGFTTLDPLPSMAWHWSYGLPPVTSRPQIGVFGRITTFASTSVGGTAVIGSDPRAVPRGEKLHFDSDHGLEAGHYHFTPLISSGEETAKTSIYGDATIYIGGELASHPEWVPWGPLSAVATALLGILLAAGMNFWFGKRKEASDRQQE